MNQDTQKGFFISYNSADRLWAEWIAWQLEEEGYLTVIQAWDFRPGSNFVQNMDLALQDADCNALKGPNPDFSTAYNQLSPSTQGSLPESTFATIDGHNAVSNCAVLSSGNQICYKFTSNTTEVFDYTFDVNEKIVSEKPTGNTC